MFKPGTYEIKGLFWICCMDEKKAFVKDKYTIGTYELKNTTDKSLEEMIKSALAIINPNLPLFLHKKSILRFFPYKCPSYDHKDNTFEICYYHDKYLYDSVYNTHPSYVLEPTEKLTTLLEKNYQKYNLASFSRNIYSTKYCERTQQDFQVEYHHNPLNITNDFIPISRFTDILMKSKIFEINKPLHECITPLYAK